MPKFNLCLRHASIMLLSTELRDTGHKVTNGTGWHWCPHQALPHTTSMKWTCSLARFVPQKGSVHMCIWLWDNAHVLRVSAFLQKDPSYQPIEMATTEPAHQSTHWLPQSWGSLDSSTWGSLAETQLLSAHLCLGYDNIVGSVESVPQSSWLH